MAAVTVLLGLLVAGEDGPTSVDHTFADSVDAWLAGHDSVLRLLVLATEPPVVLATLAVTVVVCLARRHPFGAVLAVAAPALATTLTSGALKPLFGRSYDDHLAYPSGHTAAVVSTLAVLVLVARPGVARWGVGITGLVLVAAAAVGMAGLRYHYVTDVVGGAACAVAVTIGVAAVVPPLVVRSGRGQCGGISGQRGEPAERT